MNLYTLRENLKRTISGKELALQGYKNDTADGLMDKLASIATIRFLEVNLGELKKILADVELCYKKEADESWATNPDRMGGQFTADEIAESNTWR